MDVRFRVRRLFDRNYYLKTYPDVAEVNLEPWQHFVQTGFRESRNPHPLFDLQFYRYHYLNNRTDVNPLEHYLKSCSVETNPHPLLNARFYAAQLENRQLPPVGAGETVLEHFLLNNAKAQLSPVPFFDSAAYIRNYPDVVKGGAPALYHFVRFGKQENRQWQFDCEQFESIRTMATPLLYAACNFLGQEAKFGVDISRSNPSRPSVLLVSANASNSNFSAQATLRMARALNDLYHLNVVTLLLENGDLRGQFDELGPTYCFQGRSRTRKPSEFQQRWSLVKQLVSHARPIVALVNSIESQWFMGELANLGIPIQSHLFEDAEEYPFGSLLPFFESSNRVVFSSQNGYETALRTDAIDPQKSSAIEPVALAYDIYSDSSVEDDACFLDFSDSFLNVMGTGNRVREDGLDWFVSTAIATLESKHPGNVRFVWVGDFTGLEAERVEQFRQDIVRAQLDNHIVILSEIQQQEAILEKADLFLATQRKGISHRAIQSMANGVPVIQLGGQSLLRMGNLDSGVIAVPYGNIASATKNVVNLVSNDSLRHHLGALNRQFLGSCVNLRSYMSSLLEILPTYYRDYRQPVANNNAPRVIFCSPSWEVSGVNTFVQHLAGELVKRGVSASVLFTTCDASRLEAESLPNVPYHFLTNSEVSTESRIRRLRQYLLSQKPCVLVPNFDSLASDVAEQLDPEIKTIGILHSDDEDYYRQGYVQGQNWSKIVCVSQTICEKLIRMNPSFEQKTEIIRYGIPVRSINQRTQNFSRNTDSLRIVYTGRMVQHQKRIFDFIELIQLLKKRNVSFEFSFIGDGVDLEPFVQKLDSIELSSEVRVLGRLGLDDVLDELRQHHVFCLVSEFEGLPLSMLEAMTNRCVPVVPLLDSGISEVLTHGLDSMISPIGDLRRMADHLAQLAECPGLRNSMADNARRTIFRKRLTVEQMTDHYHELFVQALRDEENSKIVSSEAA